MINMSLFKRIHFTEFVFRHVCNLKIAEFFLKTIVYIGLVSKHSRLYFGNGHVLDLDSGSGSGSVSSVEVTLNFMSSSCYVSWICPKKFPHSHKFIHK